MNHIRMGLEDKDSIPEKFIMLVAIYQVLTKKKLLVFLFIFRKRLLGWLKGILPKTALMVEEEAWNAYPYTKTRYTCPFVEKFSLEIETYYYGDDGHQENVFGLTGSDLRNRIIGKQIIYSA